MSELIEAPKWFDDIYKEVVNIINNEFSYSGDPEEFAKELMIKAISNNGFGEFWVDDLIREILFPSDNLLSMIYDNKQEKIDYVLNHKLDLIEALIISYKVKEDKYIVVSVNNYESEKWNFDTNIITYSNDDSIVKYLYYEDELSEKYKELNFDLLAAGLVFGKFEPELINKIKDLEPKLIMNKEKAQKLINSYRMMIPIEHKKDY